MATNNIRKYSGGIFFAMLIIGIYLLYIYYAKIFANNVHIEDQDKIAVYIPTGSDLHDLEKIMDEANFLLNPSSFWWMVEKKEFTVVKPGKYIVRKGMSNNDLVNMFRSGNQTPVMVKVPSVRSKAIFAGTIAKQLEVDSTELIRLMYDEGFLEKNGFTVETVMGAFLPDTYEMFWNQSAEDFFKRMQKEYDKFWNEERLSKARKLGFTRDEVSTLASIVQAEQSKYTEEKYIIAGLYINRLQQEMPLQSDPTLIFAKGDYSIQRVRNKNTQIDSRYNTYKYKGLPPGPINIPQRNSIDAVLNYQKNNYIYMCAKEDLSGKHNFATDYASHQINAQRYQEALDKKGIRR